jgi:diketogulonate reductase-like aldo/keto reductase
MAVLIAGAPLEQAAVMAKRKKRAAARRGKAATLGKARKPDKSVRGKSAKRTSAWAIRSGNVIAIPESGSVAHVKENAVALSLTLSPQELQTLDTVHPPPNR